MNGEILKENMYAMPTQHNTNVNITYLDWYLIGVNTDRGTAVCILYTNIKQNGAFSLGMLRSRDAQQPIRDTLCDLHHARDTDSGHLIAHSPPLHQNTLWLYGNLRFPDSKGWGMEGKRVRK